MGFLGRFGSDRPFPAPSLAVFFSLQALDVLTTMIGLQMGGREANVFIGTLMRLGPLRALLVSKIFAVILGMLALRYERPRVVVFLNYWFALVVAWNLATIWMVLLRAIAS